MLVRVSTIYVMSKDKDRSYVYSVHARILASGYKMHFRVSRARDFFKTVHKFKISKDRPVSV